MLYVCLHFPNLALEALQPKSSDTAVVALAENQQLVCASAGAQALGIEAGMSLSTAYSLCDKLQLHARKPEQEQQVLQTLASQTYSITPSVNLYNGNSLMLEVGCVLKLFGKLSNILDQLHQDINQHGFSYCYGLAHTPKAAFIMALHQHDSQACFNHQSQQLDVPAIRKLLSALPVTALQHSDKSQQQCQQLGLRRIGQLMALPQAAIGRRFGLDFLRYLAELYGDIRDPQTVISPPEQFSRNIVFNHYVEHIGGLYPAMQQLLDQLALYLRQHQWQCQQLSWQLRSTDARQQTIDIALHSEGISPEHWFELSQLRINKIKLQSSVEEISLYCKAFSPLPHSSGQLFKQDKHTQAPIQQLLDKLSTKIGDDKVYRLKARHNHIPEQAFSQPQSHAKADKTEQLALHFDAKRPAWLLPSPQAIKQTGNGLHWHGPLHLLEGPERIESQWQQHTVVRDYFVARHDSGATYWVFQNRADKQWFMHGVFS